MEPIARTVNYLLAHHSELHEVDMIGLSGGGWTTTVYAAIDPRIVKSIPVAGTLPLYLRGDHYNHDLEQYVPELYRVAGYKDLYVRGAVGTGRLQLQILNRYDDCCFGEKQHTVGGPPYTQAIRQYQRDVQNTLAQLKSVSLRFTWINRRITIKSRLRRLRRSFFRCWVAQRLLLLKKNAPRCDDQSVCHHRRTHAAGLRIEDPEDHPERSTYCRPAPVRKLVDPEMRASVKHGRNQHRSHP